MCACVLCVCTYMCLCSFLRFYSGGMGHRMSIRIYDINYNNIALRNFSCEHKQGEREQ